MTRSFDVRLNEVSDPKEAWGGGVLQLNPIIFSHVY